MEVFSSFLSALAALPDWVPLLLLPALLPCGALLFALLRQRNWYRHFALAVAAAGTVLVCGRGNVSDALAYAGIIAVLGLLCAPLLLVPFTKRKRKKRESREERIYRKFHEDLSEPLPPREGLPPKVCCFEEAPATPAAESGVRLGHVRSLIEKLKREKLSAADRLEVEALSRSVDGCLGRTLERSELELLNDCLASVLKLTAKYKL